MDTTTTTGPASVRTVDGKKVLRTVVLPSSSSMTSSGAISLSSGSSSSTEPATEALQLQINSLQRQVSELRVLLDERGQAYAKDRDSLIDTYNRKLNSNGTMIRQLEQQLEMTQSKLTNLTKDYLTQRHTFSTTERELRELLAQAKASKDNAEQRLMTVQGQTETDIGALKQQLEVTTSTVQAQIEAKIAQHNDILRIVKSKALEKEKELNETITTLRNENKRWKERYSLLDKRRLGDIEGYQRDITALRKAVRQLETQWALVGGIVADTAYAEQAAELQHQFDNFSEKLQYARSMKDDNEDDNIDNILNDNEQMQNKENQGIDWLPSRSAHVPPLVTSIRSGRTTTTTTKKSSTVSTTNLGRNTLVGYVPTEYASRELGEILQMQGNPLPGDLDYSADDNAIFGGRPASNATTRNNNNSKNSTTSRYNPSQNLLASPMIVEPYSPASMVHRTPGGTLHRPIRVNGTTNSTITTTTTMAPRTSTGQITPPSTTSSKSSGSSGARRVPISAPNASPLFDTSTLASSSNNDTMYEQGGGGKQGSSTNSRGISSPGTEEGLNRSFAVRDQLLGLHERVLELDRRAARLGGLVP